MDLIKLDEKFKGLVTAGCRSCYFYIVKNCKGGCRSGNRLSQRNEQGYFYINKDQVESLIEEAEEGHRNKGGEVLCDRYEDSLCATTCPRSLCSFDRYQKWFKFECLDEPDKECSFIAYRGEDPKPEDVLEYVEYVVVNKYNPYILAKTDIDPGILKNLLALSNYMGQRDVDPGKDITSNKDTIVFVKELERLGFIAEKVHDPVVKKGDKYNNNGFRLLLFGDDKHNYCFIEMMYGGQMTDWVKVGDKDSIRLSEIVGQKNLKDFKRCKMKITEAKDGE